MQVIELNGGNIDISKLSKPTDKELQSEYNYFFCRRTHKKTL